MDKGVIRALGCLITIALTIVISIYILLTVLGNMAKHRMSIPPPDLKYISRLGFYARDSLPSCKVVQKKYMEGQYTSAVYRLDSIDFAKVLKGVQEYEHFPNDTIVIFNKSAIELLRKENIDVNMLDYQYNRILTNRIGFKYPDLVVFDQTLYD